MKHWTSPRHPKQHDLHAQDHWRNQQSHSYADIRRSDRGNPTQKHPSRKYSKRLAYADFGPIPNCLRNQQSNGQEDERGLIWTGPEQHDRNDGQDEREEDNEQRRQRGRQRRSAVDRNIRLANQRDLDRQHRQQSDRRGQMNRPGFRQGIWLIVAGYQVANNLNRGRNDERQRNRTRSRQWREKPEQ